MKEIEISLRQVLSCNNISHNKKTFHGVDDKCLAIEEFINMIKSSISREICEAYQIGKNEAYELIGQQYEVSKRLENKLRLQILEEVENMIEGEKKEEAKSIDVGPIDIPDIETQGYNKGLDTILSKLKEIK